MSRKGLNILTIILFIISVIIAVFTFANSSALEKGDDGLLNPLYYWTFALFIIALALAVIMPIPGILRNPKSLKKTIFTILGLGCLFVLVYVLSTGAPDASELAYVPVLDRTYYVENSTVANMNIFGVFFMVGLSAIAVLWSAFKGLVTK